jgi:hypothetical protein
MVANESGSFEAQLKPQMASSRISAHEFQQAAANDPRHVAQIFNLPYRRIAFGNASLLKKPAGWAVPGGFQIRDAAECNSVALRAGETRVVGLRNS